MSRNLFLAITIPDDLYFDDDPDEMADRIVGMLNDYRWQKAWARAVVCGDGDPFDVHVERMMVNAIPGPQWLTPETLHRLRAAASG